MWSMHAMPPHAAPADHGKSLVLRDRRLWLYLTGMLPVMVVFLQHISTRPLFMVRELHLPPSAYGLLFTVNTGLVLALEIPLNAHTAHWPYRVTLPLGAALVSGGFGALWLCSDVWSVALTVVTWTFGEMLLLPAAVAYLSDLAPRGRSGEYVGMNSAMMSVSMMPAPAVGTVVLEHFGVRTLWTGSWVAGTLSVAVLAALPSPRSGGSRTRRRFAPGCQPGSRVTFTTTPTRYSTRTSSPTSTRPPWMASGPMRAALSCSPGSSRCVKTISHDIWP